MYKFHRYNLIRYDISSPSVAYKLFVRGLYDYAIVKEETSSGVTTRGYFVAAKDLETSWTNRASLTYSIDIRGRKLVNEGQNWLAAAGKGDTYSYLLDDYSGAAAAYSLRKLNSSYSGDAIIVRRSSDNATQSIGFSDNILDTTTLSTFCSGTNGFVATWYDQSGNGYNATQTTASQQPKIFDGIDGIVLQNGKPSIQFDGDDDQFEMNSLAGQSRLDTYFVVDTNDTTYLYPFGDNFQSEYGFVSQQGSTSTLLTNNYGTPDLYANSVLFTGTTRDDIYNFLNGSKLVVHQNADTSNWLEYKFGNYTTVSLSFSGKLQEFIAYNSDESSNRNGIETNINNFYSIY